MALGPRLQLRQSQALVMTPQLMQDIKLLQLSSLDLAAYVDAELERNPLLERANDGEPVSEGPNADAGGAGVDGGGGETWQADGTDREPAALEGGFGETLDRDTGADNVFPDEARSGPEPAALPQGPGYSEWAGVRGGREDGEYNLEAFVESETTLADHLAEQLALAVTDPRHRLIGRYLIDLVDEAGYLGGDVDDVAEKLGAKASEVEAVLSVLQTFS